MKRKSLAFTLIALAVATSIRPADAQAISFFREFPSARVDRATAVAADASGVYVFWDAGVRKYDSRGNELWTREFSAPMNVRGAAAEPTGAYALGLVGSDGRVVLRKYSADGDELWTRQLEFSFQSAGPYSRGGVAADASGVYVMGGDPFPGAFSYLRKYSPSGVELWTSRFGDRQLWIGGVAVDASGVYVMMFNKNFSSGGIVRKLDALGNELWVRELNPADLPGTIAAAYPTGFYVVARRSGTFLHKYDSEGKQLWSRPAPQGTVEVNADATGVYLAGETGTDREFVTADLPGHCKAGAGSDAFALKYDPDGGEVWARQFGPSQGAGASALAVNASGVYVAGQTGPGDGFRSAWEDFRPFDGFAPESQAGFLAKFEKLPSVAAGSGPRIFPGCVVNAASYLGGGVAPGEIVTLFGSGIGPPELVPLRLTEERRLAVSLAETRILFNGVPAPLVYVSGKQSSAIVPYAVAGRSTVDVEVEYKGVRSGAVPVPVLPARPGIFSVDSSGKGQAAILNEDGSFNSPLNPARRGSIISVFGTGGGEAAPGLMDGQILGNVLPQTSLPVSVFFDLGNNEHPVQQKRAEVLYAGGVSGSVAGLLQINVRVPANAADTGNAVPFALFIGSQWAMYQVSVALR